MNVLVTIYNILVEYILETLVYKAVLLYVCMSEYNIENIPPVSVSKMMI